MASQAQPLAPEADDEKTQARLKELMELEEPATRTLNQFWALIVALMSVGMAGFYIYTAATLPAQVQYQRGVYVMITFLLILILYPALPRKSKLRPFVYPLLERIPTAMRSVLAPRGGPSILDLALMGITFYVVNYYIQNFRTLQFRAGNYNETDFMVGVVGLIIALEIARRVLGWSMTLIGAFFLLYMRYGYLLYDLPIIGAFAHRGQQWQRVATVLFFDQEGVFGVMANVLVSYVILFIFFGAVLSASGASRFFIDLPLAIAGRTTGGPAKVAVISSALFGSISGSAIANTVSTGTFTIPLMKRAGFRPHVAGAIEPSASIGGAFMPPVMGAGAFVMAELTSIPYATIVLISIVPAILYFTSVLTMVHFEAKKYGLKGIEAGKSAWEIIRDEWYLALPLIVMIVMLTVGYSPGLSAVWAIIVCIPLMFTMPANANDLRHPQELGGSTINAIGRSTWRVIQTCYEAMQKGVRDTLVIGGTVGVIGIIVGTIYATGIGQRFANIIINFSGGSILAAVALIGIASLLLGMGVPVTAAYLIVAVITVPALQEMGIAVIAAHMIVYWFSQDSNITPPVCVAAYAGAAIAGADPWKTGWTAFKFAKLLYVMPLLFAFTPEILMVGHTGKPLVDVVWAEVAMSWFSATLGTIAFSAVSMFYLVRQTTWLEWIIAAFGTFLCFWPNLLTDVVGIMIFSGVWMWQYYDVKRKKEAVKPQQAT
ncbi:MAG: TRAP transporter fused permease subunit [Candidatus Viridilinea halotolerans]|uniref:TRAP transporter fused permease subunit n=1 Tax=Candidatus Viridilinea halotolerans TaxID=2491704 RepID=A0A426UCB8_9CHLR|nr:MAG: TRAP transporter fused permease subunit [Candidatus Viridilinea halotolerans]